MACSFHVLPNLTRRTCRAFLEVQRPPFWAERFRAESVASHHLQNHTRSLDPLKSQPLELPYRVQASQTLGPGVSPGLRIGFGVSPGVSPVRRRLGEQSVETQPKRSEERREPGARTACVSPVGRLCGVAFGALHAVWHGGGALQDLRTRSDPFRCFRFWDGDQGGGGFLFGPLFGVVVLRAQVPSRMPENIGVGGRGHCREGHEHAAKNQASAVGQLH